MTRDRDDELEREIRTHLDLEAAAVVRAELGVAVAEFDADRFLDLDVAAGFALDFEAGAHHAFGEGRGAAVDDRAFGAGDGEREECRRCHAPS